MSKTAWMKWYYVLVHVCTDPSHHNGRTFCYCQSCGARGGDTVLLRIWDSWPLRNRETFEKCPLPPVAPPPRSPTPLHANPFLPSGRQRNLKSRWTLSGTIYVTGPAGAHCFSGMGSYLVCIAKRSCSCRVEDTLQHKNNGQLRLVMCT